MGASGHRLAVFRRAPKGHAPRLGLEDQVVPVILPDHEAPDFLPPKVAETPQRGHAERGDRG